MAKEEKMKIHRFTFILFLVLIFCTSCKEKNKTELPIESSKPKTTEVIVSKNRVSTVVPSNITRSIAQDQNGNIWFATFDGVFLYDGNTFSNMTSTISSTRFFSVLEDSNGKLWFGSIGSGIYSYDGKSFENFATLHGLVSDAIVSIYEDNMGNIWFGGNGGVSRYNGKTFKNYSIDGDSIVEDKSNNNIIIENSSLPFNEVNSIIQDKKGTFWFSTRGNTFTYDGKTFTTFTNNDEPFTNVRTIIEDKKGNIWLAGADGLWSYDGSTFTNFTQSFVGFVYEDKEGNIWTSSQENYGSSWALSRYEERSLFNKVPIVTKIKSGEGMIFGILEAQNGDIWFGTLNGVSRFDGKTITNFKGKTGLD
jgi:ligand-binding sensor domain-containing protein